MVSFEIKVALLGHVSVGKTTVLNALLQDKFSEVSMRRTTAGINHFRISNTNNASCSSKEYDEKTAKQALKETTEDNSILRKKNAIQEKYFSINVDVPLVQMREDTHLVLVDIPGVNEAGSSKLYLDYVKDSWDQFDCVIVVMDAVQGVNTEEQVELLNFVKQNQDEKKQVPLIILVNKVDDPDDKEVKLLVDEIRDKVDQIFNVPNQKKQPSARSSRNTASPQESAAANPAFIPISAENGFLYRAASRLQLSEFSMLDMDYIDKIGREELGRFKWKKLRCEQKYEAVYKVVSDPSQYEERLAVSNFDKFLSALELLVGGEKTQECLIGKQLEVALSKLSSKNDIAGSLSSIYDKCKVLGKPAEVLRERFWMLFTDCCKDAIKSFYEDPREIKALHKPMEELRNYSLDLHKKLHSCRLAGVYEAKEADSKKIAEAMKDIIKGQCNVLVKKEAEWKLTSTGTSANWCWQGQWYNSVTGAYNNDLTVHPEGDKPEHWKWDPFSQTWQHIYTGYCKRGKPDQNPALINKASNKLSPWDNMSQRDWSTAISSILLMTHSKYFCENFGQQIVDLQWLLHAPGEFNSVKMARDQSHSSVSTSIKVPDSPSDPNHWGHLVWMFCEHMDSWA